MLKDYEKVTVVNNIQPENKSLSEHVAPDTSGPLYIIMPIYQYPWHP